MEEPNPILNTPIEKEDINNINYIEELIITQDNKKYRIQFGINESSNNQNQMILKVTPFDIKYCYFQNIFDLEQLQEKSQIFSFYNNIKDIISLLKTLKYEIQEKDKNLILKINICLQYIENKLIEFNLQQKFLNSEQIIQALLEENKLLKVDISKNQNEISLLKEDISKNKNEISSLREQIIINQNDISMLIEQNKNLLEEINKLKKANKAPEILKAPEVPKIQEVSKVPELKEVPPEEPIINIPEKVPFNSKILSNSIYKIDFILKYLREHDKSNSFSWLDLLYRASRDGDSTETCHRLCDDKQNILIIIKSETGYIFGGYTKIGFRTVPNFDHKIDNYSFLFSYNSDKIYPVIKNEAVICHLDESYGLCFNGSLSFRGNFMKYRVSSINGGKTRFTGFREIYEMNGGESQFIIRELEVFQFI